MGQHSYNISIEELVSKIERGEIKLPEMQRRYVWPATRVRDLLDSLYREYPSGTILTWETDSNITTQNFAISQKTSSSDSFQLLLDGQQRLTSLSAILRGDPVSVKGRKKPIDILFNLEHPDELTVVTEVNENKDIDNDAEPDEADASEEDIFKRIEQMAFVVKSPRLANSPHWVSVTEVFKSNSDAEFLKKCGIENLDDPRFSKYTERLKRLRDIKKYMYRVEVLERNKSYEEVTEIFVRVNSLGTKLRGSDLALAQITAKWQNSLKIFEAFQKECKKGGFDYDLGIYIKNLIAFATGQSHFKTVNSLSAEQLKEGWEKSKRGFEFALNFLKSNVDIGSPALLSSPFLIITLGYFAAQNDYALTPQQQSDLRYWLLVANAKGRYSRGSSENYLDQDLGSIKKESISAMIKHLRTQFGRLEVTTADLEGRNSRSPYFKTMFLVFRADNAKDWIDGLGISLKHAGVAHKLQFHHIFPQSILREANISKEKINDIANLSFIGGRTNQKISNKPPSDYLPAIVKKQGEEALTRQSIPTDSDLWAIDKYDAFLAKRRELITDRLNAFMGHDEYKANMEATAEMAV